MDYKICIDCEKCGAANTAHLRVIYTPELNFDEDGFYRFFRASWNRNFIPMTIDGFEKLKWCGFVFGPCRQFWKDDIDAEYGEKASGIYDLGKIKWYLDRSQVPGECPYRLEHELYDANNAESIV